MRPGRCPACRALVAVSVDGWREWAAAAVDNLAIFGGVAVAFLYRWWALVPVAFALAFCLALFATAPMRVVTLEQVQRRRRSKRVMAAVVLVAIILVGLYDTYIGGSP